MPKFTIVKFGTRNNDLIGILDYLIEHVKLFRFLNVLIDF